jgi:hypothetical protein
MNYFSLVLSVLMFLGNAADVKAPEASLIKDYPKDPLINEIISFEPVAGHHFNLEAKNACGNGRLVSVSQDMVECQMSAPGTSRLELFVCDQKQTFCRREELNVKTQQPEGVLGWFKYYKKTLLDNDGWSAPHRSGVVQLPPLKGFISEDVSKAIAKAKIDKKKVVVAFVQTASLQSQQLKEIVLASDEFQQATNDAVRVQVDFDVDLPTELRGLGVWSTPTVIVFNKDFQEVGRSTEVVSPRLFVQWYKDLSPTPIAILAVKPVEQMTDDEKYYMAKWNCDLNTSEGSFKSLSLINAIKAPNPKHAMSVSFAKRDFTLTGLLAWVKKTDPSINVKSPEVVRYSSIVDTLLNNAADAQNKSVFTQAVPFALNQIKRVQGLEDVVARDLVLFNHYFVLKNTYQQIGNEKESKKWLAKQVEVIDTLMKELPQLPSPSYLAAYRASAAGDPTEHQKILALLREKNKADISYDLGEAYDALNNKDYEKALTKVDESLKVAKDRNWQTAFLLKIDILKELKRQDAAKNEIAQVLGKTQLPGDSKLEVHKFVQNLRKEQLSLMK